MLDPSTSQDKVKHLLEKLKELYGEYAKNLNPFSLSQPQSSRESQTLSKPSEEGSKPKKSRVYSDFKTFQSESNSITYKSELDFYLDDPHIVVEDNEDFDVLYYWKINETRYPKLSILARDVLSIPITTVASESAFSIGGRVLTKYRSSTLPENVEMLICTRNWLLGFVEDDTDEGNSTSSGNGMSDDEGISKSSDHDAHLTPLEPIIQLGTSD